MDTEHKFNVYWSFGKKGITFKLEIESLGFVELGFSLSGGMEGADIVIAWVDDDDGEVHLTDRYGLPTDVTDRYGLSTLDKTQNLKLQLGYQNNTHTVVQFYRDWDTCDEEDVKLGHDTVRMIWGHHEKDLLQPPSHSGIRSVHLMEEMPEATQLPEHKVWDVTAGNINVPHDDKTHYFCRIVKLPDAAQISKHHIIAVEPLIQPGSDALINHMTLSECHVPDTLLEGLLDHKGSECWGPGMPPVFYYCRSIIAAWALGNPGYRIADHVGLPLGQKFGGATYYRLEVHYDNPSLMSGFVDDSGLRISYTDKLREMDMGYLFTGIAINFMHVIPPKQDQFLSSGQCSSECTQEVIPKEGVKVFQLFHHTQSAGRKIRVRHIRNGLELPLITEDNNFDYTYHGSREPTNEILILPGDTLITECEYQTDETTIHGGLSTRDEMCIVFMAYYPKSNLSECSSGPTFSTFLSSMGIEKLVGGANLEKLIDYTYHTNPSLYKFEDRINVVNNLAAEVNLDGDILELLFDKKFYEDFSHQTDVIMRILMKMKIEAPSDLSGLTVEYVTNGMDWSMRGLEMSRILNKKEHSYKCSGPQRKPLLKYTTYKAPSFTKLIKEDFCDVTNITIN